MKIISFLVGCCLLAAIPISAQSRKPINKKTELAKTIEISKPDERPVTVFLTEGEPVSGRFVDASSEGIHIVIAGNKLILRWKDVSQVVYTDVPPVETATPKVLKEKESIENAVKSLKKLSSAVEVGINFQEYSRRLIDVKIEFEGYISDISDSESKLELKQAMNAFEDAKAIWDFMVGNNISGRPTGDLFPDYEPGKSLKEKYSLPTYRTSGLHLMEGEKSMKIIWGIAQGHIESVVVKMAPK